jgi:hypothetical protein
MIKDIDIIKEHLLGYMEVELPYPFKRGEKIKYITMRDDGESFYIGGDFVSLGNNCIILQNNLRNWCVPICKLDKHGNVNYKSRFFIGEKELEECNENNKKLKETVEFQQQIIDKLERNMRVLEKENILLKKYIDSI